MPIWYYERSELEKTPSRDDGIDFTTEARYRKEGARFISDAGNSLGLRYDTLATGVVYFHRFYMFHSFKTFPRYVTGAACLFLAGKVEETPKKCKDIVKAAKTLLPEHYFSTFGADPKEEIMTFERILLQTIKFDLQVDHPYGYLLKYAKRIKGDIGKVQKLVQMAWTFINDSLGTTLSLQWEPEVLAVAVIYLAGRLSKSDVLDWQCKSSRTKWWDPFIEDVTLEMLEDICHQVLDLYTPGQEPGQLHSKAPTMMAHSPAKVKVGRPKTPPEPAPQTPPEDEPPMKMAKLEAPPTAASTVSQPGPPLEPPPPLPQHPALPQPPPMPQEPPTIQHQQYSQSSGYPSVPPPSLPSVPQVPPPPPVSHDVPPQPPSSVSSATYQNGTYPQTSTASTVYGASQSYPPQQQTQQPQQPAAANTYQYSGVQSGQGQTTQTTNYGQSTTYNYQQSQQSYGAGDQYQQNYTGQEYRAPYSSTYNQSNTANYPASSQYDNTTQYQSQYQSGQYPSSQQATAPSYPPTQQQTTQQQQNIPQQNQDRSQQYNTGVASSAYTTTPSKNYPAQNYSAPPGYDGAENYSSTGEHGKYPSGSSGHGWGPRMPHPATPRGQLPHSTSPGASTSAITPTGLATVRITGRTDQRRSSTGRGQPFFR